MQEPEFKIGEKVLNDITYKEGIVINIGERFGYEARYRYLVEYEHKTLFGKIHKYSEWTIDVGLNKLTIQ